MRSLRVLLVAVLALAGVGVLASPADAHALLERSYPAAGTSLPRAPHIMLLYFTEAPDPSLSTVSLLDSSGQTLPGVGKPAVAPRNARELRVRLPRLADGVYTVNWRTVSKVDGHITGGSFAFGIGVQPPSGVAAAANGGSQSTGSTPSPAAVAGLWLLYWGLALLVAAGATGVLVFGWRLPRGARIVIAAGWLAAAAGIIIMILSERTAAAVPFGELFGAAAGRSLLAQAAAVAVCGMAAFFAARRPAGPALAVLGAAAAGALFVHAQAGHAETQSSVRLLNVADQWLHMLAAGVWVGGLVWLLLGLRSLDAAARSAAVRRFSQLAFVAVAVIAVTGVLRAVPEVGSLGALVSTSFGVTLLIKTGLFAVLMAIAWRNRYRLVPKLAEPAPAAPAVPSPVVGGADPPKRAADTEYRPPMAGAPPPEGAAARAIGSLQRSVRSEVTVAAIVLVVAAVLSGLPPASFVEATAHKTASPLVTVTGSDYATTARVRLAVAPGTVGPNRFTVHVVGYDSGRPLPARGVRLEFSLPSNPTVASSLNLPRGPGGTWTGQGTNLSIDGQWDIDVVVQQATTGLDVLLRLRTLLPPEHITVSRQPGQPTLYTIQLGNGRSLQTYLQQPIPGQGLVHFTFFQASGQEEPITSASATAVTPGGADQPLKLTRLASGHFVANLSLTPGQWTFRINATPAAGQPLSGYFSQTIPR